MNNQIKTEAIKLRKSVFFYLVIVMFIVFGLMNGLKSVFADMRGESGIDALFDTISDTSLMFVLTLFVSYLIGNEFTNRTIDNEIRIGYSRFSVILSRAIVVLPFTVVVYLAYSITMTLIFGIATGFESAFTVYDLIIRLLLFSLQVMAIQSISLFVMFACKRASLGMMINVSLTVVTCNILRNLLEDGGIVFKYTSFYRIMLNNQSMTSQDILISYVSALVTLLLVLCATYIAFRKAELK